MVHPSAFGAFLVCAEPQALTQPLPYLPITPPITRAKVQFKLGCAGSATCESDPDQRCTKHVDCIEGSECAIIASCLPAGFHPFRLPLSSPLLFSPLLLSSPLLSSYLLWVGGYVCLLLICDRFRRLQQAREMCQLLRMRVEQRRHRRALPPRRMQVEQQDDCQATMRIRRVR